MNAYWVIGIICVVMNITVLLMMRRLKATASNWSLLDGEEVLYEESSASGTLYSNGLKGIGGASNILRIRVTAKHIAFDGSINGKLSGMFKINVMGDKFGYNRIIPIDAIEKVGIKSGVLYIYYTDELGEQLYKCRSKDPDKICALLGFIEKAGEKNE